jgi:hypothetical protein
LSITQALNAFYNDIGFLRQINIKQDAPGFSGYNSRKKSRRIK